MSDEGERLPIKRAKMAPKGPLCDSAQANRSNVEEVIRKARKIIPDAIRPELANTVDRPLIRVRHGIKLKRRSNGDRTWESDTSFTLREMSWALAAAILGLGIMAAVAYFWLHP